MGPAGPENLQPPRGFANADRAICVEFRSEMVWEGVALVVNDPLYKGDAQMVS
jgi:hypothetical protein